MKDVQTNRKLRSSLRFGGWLLLCVGLCLGFGAAVAQPSPPTNATSMAMMDQLPHGTRNFFVRGGTFLQNVETGNWAEEIVRLVESELNRPLVFQPNQPIRIQIDNDKSSPRVYPVQQNRQGDLVQRLHVHRIDKIDDEELLESLCFLLCSRYVMDEARRRGDSGHNPKPPEWFTTGLAQYVIRDLRDRDRRLVYADWDENFGPGPLDLLQHEVFEEGRKGEKAACAMLFGFLRDQSNFTDMLNKMLVTWSLDRKVDAPWLINQLIPVRNELEMQMHWDLWMAWNETEMREVWDVSVKDQIASLKKLMSFRPRELGLAGFPGDQVNATSWNDLIVQPRDKWHSSTVSHLLVRLNLLALGQPNSFRAVLDEFSVFLQALVPSLPVDGEEPRVPGPAEERQLAQMLGSAQRSLVEYELRVAEAQSLLELADSPDVEEVRPLTDGGPIPETEPVMSDNPTPEEFQRYLRWLEAQKLKEESENEALQR